MVVQTQLVTADQLLALPDDGHRYELVRGELRKMPPAGFEHGELSLDIGASLSTYVKAHNLGKACGAETGFLIGSDPDHVLAPDAAFVRRERDAAASQVTGYWPGPPDLAVEVISPNDRYTEVEEKVADWLAAGVQMVILVDPRRRSVTLHAPGHLDRTRHPRRLPRTPRLATAGARPLCLTPNPAPSTGRSPAATARSRKLTTRFGILLQQAKEAARLANSPA